MSLELRSSDARCTRTYTTRVAIPSHSEISMLEQPEIYQVLISINCGGWLCNRCASMHPASDVRYFVIMNRAMFIAILNGRRGGDLARISRDTRLLRCAFRNTPGKKHYCLFSRSFFFCFFRYVGEFFKKRPATGNFWKLDSAVDTYT